MDSDGLPIVGAGVDYTTVGPIHQKRTLTFLNHFLIRTTSFLNHFSTICDEKLENLLIRIQRLEASMCILEAKLASISGLEDVIISQPSPSHENGNAESLSTVATTSPDQPSEDASKIPASPAQNTENEKPIVKLSNDPRFAKYFRMVNMGVPVAAVKLKMNAEGVNADLLDNPDAEAPPGGSTALCSTEADQSSSGEFSD